MTRKGYLSIGISILAVIVPVILFIIGKEEVICNPYQKDEYGRTCLMRAADSGDVSLMRKLIKAGADVNAKDNHDSTVLMYATLHAKRTGKTETMQILIKEGAYINKQDKEGRTALMLAIENDLIKWFITGIKNFNGKVDDRGLKKAEQGIKIGEITKDKGKTTVRIVANNVGMKKAIRKLLDAGAKLGLSLKNEEDKTAFDIWKAEQKNHDNYEEIAELLRPLL